DWGPPALASGITLIEDNRLFYRGRDAVELARSATVEDTARLLWQCETDDPFSGQLEFTGPVGAAGALPIDRCLALLAERGVYTRMIWQRDVRRLWPEAATLLRLMAAGIAGSAPST
ncbi:citrate/2-methylcitrate synthase, partial [Klebsiella pneumoniae]|uniref:citrate/2-methylcitrate synthase n=1 Tax=Klebsiella pneumoniae TaxID=573 RepID=UPI001953A415